MKIEQFSHDGDKYYKLAWSDPELPKVTGLTSFRQQTIASGYKTPWFCNLMYLLNYPVNLGELQIGIRGGFGSGKSQLLNRLVAYKLGINYRCLTFFDMFNEPRNLIKFGVYDNEEKEFTPFKVNYLFPKGYKPLKLENPLWKLRKNVTKTEYSTVEELVDNILNRDYTINAVYTDCYTTFDRIKLYVLLMQYLQAADINPELGQRPVLFYHHEISNLFPNLLSKQNYRLLDLAAGKNVHSRKGFVCHIVASQLMSEVYYRYQLKFQYIVNFRQRLGSKWNPAQKNASNYETGECNIEREGYFMRLMLNPIKEITNKYRVVPDWITLDLDSLLNDRELNFFTKEISTSENKGKPTFTINEIKKYRNAIIRNYKDLYPQSTHPKIGEIFSLSPRRVGSVIQEDNTLDESFLNFEFFSQPATPNVNSEGRINRNLQKRETGEELIKTVNN